MRRVLLLLGLVVTLFALAASATSFSVSPGVLQSWTFSDIEMPTPEPPDDLDGLVPDGPDEVDGLGPDEPDVDSTGDGLDLPAAGGDAVAPHDDHIDLPAPSIPEIEEPKAIGEGEVSS